MKIQILCTLGPASMEPEVIRELDARDVDLFRINLSHTPLEQVEPSIELVQACSPSVGLIVGWRGVKKSGSSVSASLTALNQAER